MKKTKHVWTDDFSEDIAEDPSSGHDWHETISPDGITQSRLNASMDSFSRILETAANADPDKPLFIFPETRWQAETTLSYGSLAARAGIIAKHLAALVRPGSRALLLFPTGCDFWGAFFGCLSAGVIAVPLRLPSFNRTSEHLRRVCADCTPSLILTDSRNAELLSRRRDRHPYFEGVPALACDNLSGDSGQQLSMSGRAGTPVAYLQYTSGSTSHPKGVQITHQNLLANAKMIRDRMEIRTGDDRNVTWLPHYHDMGLVGSYLETLFTQNTAWCLPPEDFALQPLRWLELISEHQATVCGGPDFAYRICAERVTAEQLREIDLSPWRVAFNGAERIRPGTLRRFTETFEGCGFRQEAFFPCYGLSEATLMVTGGPASDAPVIRRFSTNGLQHQMVRESQNRDDVTELSGSGQSFDDCRVMIIDPATGEQVEDDQIGHIIVAGDNVTPGYFGRDASDQQTLVQRNENRGTETFTETGDLGFWSNSELFITGRLREMMVFRGRNFFPEDIEEQVWESHEDLQLRRAVAFSVERDDETHLIIAAEIGRQALRNQSFQPIISGIRQSTVESFGISPSEVLLLRPATIPLTTSGKQRRLLVRSTFLDGKLEPVASG